MYRLDIDDRGANTGDRTVGGRRQPFVIHGRAGAVRQPPASGVVPGQGGDVQGFVGWVLATVGQYAIDRDVPERAALLDALAQLKAGGAIGVFPEGTRGDGRSQSRCSTERAGWRCVRGPGGAGCDARTPREGGPPTVATRGCTCWSESRSGCRRRRPDCCERGHRQDPWDTETAGVGPGRASGPVTGVVVLPGVRASTRSGGRSRRRDGAIRSPAPGRGEYREGVRFVMAEFSGAEFDAADGTSGDADGSWSDERSSLHGRRRDEADGPATSGPGAGGRHRRPTERRQVDPGESADRRREAVVQDIPGVTRDRVAYDAQWRGRRFTVVDTGGWESEPSGTSGSGRRAGGYAHAHLRCVVLVVDASGRRDRHRRGRWPACCAGPTVPVMLVANKVDDEAARGRRRVAVVARPRRAVPGVRPARARVRRPARRSPRRAADDAAASSSEPSAVRAGWRWSASPTSASRRC